MSVSIPDFWKLLIESQLLTREQCQHLATQFGGSQGAANDVQVLAKWLISQNVISRYQAAVVLAGRAGPFCYGDYKIYERVEDYFAAYALVGDRLSAMAMPAYLIAAQDDPIIPVDQVEAFASTLKSLGKDVDVKIYPNTKHAFSNPSGMAYQPEAAEHAWSRTLAFLRTHLVN